MADVSFELFPARADDARAQLRATLARLEPLRPAFVSVTCGAGGSGAADATVDTLRTIAAETRLRAAGHLTAAGRSRAEVDGAAHAYWAAGVRHIVALRGDMPGAQGAFVPHALGYRDSLELIAAARRIAPFEISVAAYPEPHPDSRSLRGDLELLARKAHAGATRAITQFCFRTERIVRLRDAVARAGVGLEIVPGIMLAANFDGTRRMAERCGASIPEWLAASFHGTGEEPDTGRLLAAIVAAAQVDQLRHEGFDAFHFYTLNRADIAGAVCRLLAARDARSRERAA